MPLSIIEAMAVGLPVVAVAENGLPEIIKDGLNGFLVQADQPDLLAKKLLDLANQPQLLNQFSRASQDEAAKYSKQEITKKLIAAYTRVAKKT